MSIVPRNRWCTVPQSSWWQPTRMRVPAAEVWLHHGASGSSSLATANAYAAYHIRSRRWGELGYSFVIAAGTVLEGRGAGVEGAHTRGRNGVSHGICIAGDYTRQPPAAEDLDALVWLLQHGHDRGWWTAPQLTGGHRDAPGATTACPGDALHRLIPDINNRANAEPEPEGWIDMATEEDVRRIVREEVEAAFGGRNYATDAARLRRSVRAIAADMGLDTVHPVEDGYQVEA